MLVIGAGIVGLSCALELARRGRRVTVIDCGPIDGGCAVGSAGHLVPSHVVPLAAPGALSTAVEGLLRKNGAVSVTWSTAPSFWRWIVTFVRSCTRRSVETAAPALNDLAGLSMQMWDDWIAVSGEPVAADGLLDVYGDRRAFDAAVKHAHELQAWGINVDLLDGDQARALEPALLDPVAGAIRLPDDRNLHPGHVVAGLIERVATAGVVLIPDAEAVGFATGVDRVSGVRTTQGDLAVGEVVVATGAWSGKVARLLGQRVPMLAARGLSLTVERPQIGPRRAMLLGENHVAIGPMGDELRLSAWFQLNNFDTDPTLERISRLEAIARQRVRLDEVLSVRRRWAGLRPVTPDGVPVIGRLDRWRNVTIAAGHGMTGLTLGPGTGRVVAQLVCGDRPDISLDRFSPRRFS